MPDAVFDDAFDAAQHPPGCPCSAHHVVLDSEVIDSQAVLADNYVGLPL